MIAGRMKYRLRILKPVTTTGRFGEKSSQWVETATVHAERVKMSGRRTMQDSEVFPDYTVEFNIRDRHEIHENWRVEQLGGNTYSVAAIIPNLDRGYMTLVCDRLNE